MATTRNTVQRQIVEEQLATLCHPTAEQVYNAIHERYPRLGKATVYRTLNKLEDEGTIQRIRINNGPDCFDTFTHPHNHIRCVVCGRVDDLDPERADGDAFVPPSYSEMASARSGYEVTGYSLQFDGVCPHCQSIEREAV